MSREGQQGGPQQEDVSVAEVDYLRGRLDALTLFFAEVYVRAGLPVPPALSGPEPPQAVDGPGPGAAQAPAQPASVPGSADGSAARRS
jgi:hypothetical protein